MNSKEQESLQKYLDSMFFSTLKQKRSVYANKNLSADQKDQLYDVVKAVKGGVLDLSKLDEGLAVVAKVLMDINFHKMQTNMTKRVEAIERDKMPFLVKQVLWLICYKELDKGLEQYKVFAKMKKLNIHVSHNFFSSMGMTPLYYKKCQGYQQAENPCKYMEQKKGELAVAIKNLAYQAGKYSCFVDIFGGSASASAAVCPKNKRTKYIYNEKNRVVYNYVDTISGKDYKKVIKALEEIQQDIGTVKKRNALFGFDKNKEIDLYLKGKLTGKYAGYTLERENEIRSVGDMDYKINQSQLAKMMQTFPQEIKIHQKRIEEAIADGKLRGIKSFSQLERMETKKDFYAHEDELAWIYYQYLFCPMYMDVLSGETPNDNILYADWRLQVRQYKAFAYFCYFYSLRNKKGQISGNDRIKYAVGEIYLHYFATEGSIGSSAIIYNITKHHSETKSHEIYNFLRADFSDSITRFHEQIERFNCSNKDYMEIIKEYSNPSYDVLFYSGSPYADTKDYIDEANDIKSFTSNDDMPRLIQSLFLSKKKFIFSMRAVKSTASTKSSVALSKIEGGNKDIYQYVYKNFENQHNKNLYVLAIYRDGENLSDLIRKSKVIEIMVTNFKIVGFEYNKENNNETVTIYKYDAYCFNDFMKIIKGNMQGYNKEWDNI